MRFSCSKPLFFRLLHASLLSISGASLAFWISTPCASPVARGQPAVESGPASSESSQVQPHATANQEALHSPVAGSLLPDTVSRASCPVGSSVAAFLIFSKCPAQVWDSLFGSANASQHRDDSEFLSARTVQTALAKKTHLPPSEFRIIGGMFRVENGPVPGAHVTNSGSGFVLVTRRDERKIAVNLCSIDGHQVLRPLAHAVLRDHELLLTKLRIDGDPFVLAIRPRISRESRGSILDDELLMSEKSAFERDLAEHAPHSLDPHLPIRFPQRTLSLESCQEQMH